MDQPICGPATYSRRHNGRLQPTQNIIANGGVGNLQHLVEGVTQGHASAVLAASIFYFGEASLADAHVVLRAAGLAARIAKCLYCAVRSIKLLSKRIIFQAFVFGD